MSVESIIATTAASAGAEEQNKTASPPVEQTTEEVQKPGEDQPVQGKPASEETVLEPEVETEPNLEAQPETSGDYAKYKKVEIVVDGKNVPLFQAFPDLRNILGREAHWRPPKIDITCDSGFSAARATGADSFADHTVSGRLCKRRMPPLCRSIAHSISWACP